jgi:hypothetical protein
VANRGFESGLGGWRKGSSRTTLARVCSVAHSGSCSAELGRTRSGDALLDDSPDTVAATAAGATYTALVWVRAPAGRTVKLRLRELRRGSVVRSRVATITGTGAWRQLVVVSAPASGGTTLGLEVLVSLARGSKAHVDDVSLRRN